VAPRRRPAEAADALRAAVDRTVQATVGQAQMTRGRAQEVLDELTQAAGRVRESLDDVRLATGEDVKDLSRRLARLERRVRELEKGQSRAPAKSPPSRSRGPSKRRGGARGGSAS
jgi:polyhydroxyalkanoate synthesis regulator phasin